MKYYFDTSALLKFYHVEDGTDKVSDLIKTPGNIVYISELAKIEFVSALFRRLRCGELEKSDLSEALSLFNEDVKRFFIEPLHDAVIKEAKQLLMKYGENSGLRTLDALHLASFVLLNLKDGIFVAADLILIEVADRMGLKTLNPIEKN
jgi:uncharacterized protein